MRFPLAVSLKSRDGGVDKDAKVVNGIVEAEGPLLRSTMRPGNSDLGLVRAGTAQGAYYFNGQIVSAHDNSADRSTLSPLANASIGSLDAARSVTISRAARTGIATNITRVGATATVNLPFASNLFVVGEVVTITDALDAAYNGAKTLTAVTASSFSYAVAGTPATPDAGTFGTGVGYSGPDPSLAGGIVAGGHGFVTGQSVVIAGAAQAAYNGTKTITVTGSTSFTFTGSFSGVATPATGTITATPSSPSTTFAFADNGLTAGSSGYLVIQGETVMKRLTSDWDFDTITGPGVITAPGVVFLDGYFFVMDGDGNVWNSDLDTDPADVAAWDATSFIKANKFSGRGKRLARTGNYIVALKDYSTETFYDAGNPAPGSPLSPVANAQFPVGCASAASVANIGDSLAWIAQTRDGKGRSVYLMSGLQQQRISTPDVDRILDADDLSTVYAYGLKIGGHVLYLLTLVSSDITLVYDLTAQTWTQWSSLTAQTPASISSITLDGTAATVTFAAAHNLNDGDPLLIAGATPSGLNALWQVSYSSSTVVTFPCEITGSVTGTITGTRYVESYFKFSHYVNAGGRDILLHESDGHLYEILPSLYQDDEAPIRHFTRSPRLDGGDLNNKRMAKAVIVADAVDAEIMVRWSDDDCQTFNAYRRIDLSLKRPGIRRCGPFRRRTVETCHVGNNALRLEAIDLEVAE